jgi:transposase
VILCSWHKMLGVVMVWRQGQRYSDDLRARVLAAVDGGMAARAAAAVFQVSVSYIYKALIRRRRTGEVNARTVRGHRPRKLTPAQEAALAAHVEAHSDMTLAAMQAWLDAEHRIHLSSGAMWTIIDRFGLTFKKRRSGPASKTGRTWRRGGGSGGRRSPISIPIASSSSTRPALPPR